tara:strand:- start:1295 stop:2224 length:930 start_codon:yes stop_codon:yes gene_type:complete
MALSTTPNVEILVNTLDRSIQYKSIRKEINDDYWESDIVPILYPLWDSAKDKLEMFVYRLDNTFLIQRTKYKKDFKTGEGSWSSYEFDPAGASEYDVTDLRQKMIDKFVEYKDIQEEGYESVLQKEYARTNAITWKRIGYVRRFLLQDSDYTVGNDSPYDADTIALWKQYRTYIRDLPELQTGVTPFDVVFPITPTEYLKRKDLPVDADVTAAIGDQGVTAAYLTSSYHFWKMSSNTLSTFTQKMSFYIAAKVASSDETDENTRIMVSDFKQKFTGNPEIQTTRIQATNDKANQDYLEQLLQNIQDGVL